jgi:hypothetical protein
VAVYRQRARELSTRMTDTLRQITVLSESAASGDATWRSRYRNAFIDLRLAAQDLARLDPPPCYAAFHTTLSEAAGHYDRAAAVAIQAINLLEQGRAAEAAPIFQQASLELNEGTASSHSAVQRIPEASC